MFLLSSPQLEFLAGKVRCARFCSWVQRQGLILARLGGRVFWRMRRDVTFWLTRLGEEFLAEYLARGRSEMQIFWRSLACILESHFLSGPMLFEVNTFSCKRLQWASRCCIGEVVAYG